MRIGIIRESMLVRPGDKAAEPIATAAAAEIKAVLGEKLGATLVESADPLWERDRDLEQMNPDFRHGLARLVPVFMPDLLFRLGPDGQPLFKEFAAAIRPTEFAARQDLRQRHDGADRLLRRAGRRAASRRPPISTSPRSRSRSWR